MNDQTTQIVESLSIDGPIGITGAIGIGVLLAVLFAGLLWSQRQATGTGWAIAFWGLRVIAIAVVLWMLLGPSWVTQRRTTKPQSIAVLVDTSESMDVNDPPSTRQFRWAQSASGDSATDDPLIACDRAVVGVHAAVQRSQLARQAVLYHRSPRDIRKECDAVAEAVRRAVVHLETSISAMTGDAAENRGKAERVLTLLDGNIAADLREVDDALDDSTAAAEDDLAESLLSIQDALVGAERRLSELTRSLENTFATGDGQSASDQPSGMTRREYVSRTLDDMQQEDAEEIENPVTLKAFRFDRQVTGVSFDNGWSEGLRPLEAGSHTGDSAEEADSDLPRTNLSAALDQLGRAAASDSIRSAILITDGGHNDSAAVAPQEVAQSLAGIPVHVVPIGNTEMIRDAMLYRLDAPAAVVQKDSILIDVIVTAFQCAGEKSRLVLRKNGEPIDERALTFDGDRIDSRVSFQVEAEELGRQEFELSLDPLDDEASTTNNMASLTVNVVNDSLRVLLVDRIARWEFRYLDQLFRRDESVTFDKLLFHPEVRATGAIAQTGRLPRDVEGWSNYDVVILGDIDPQYFDQSCQQGLDEFVRTRGGHLIVIAGAENMPQGFVRQPIMDLLPVERGRELSSAQGLGVRVAPAGRNHPVLTIAGSWPESELLWTQQYERQPLTGLSDYSHPKPTTESLLAVDVPGRAVDVQEGADRSPEHAFLCWHQVGAGRVVFVSAPSTYSLRFRYGDRYHHRFWGQLMRWLTAAERAGGSQLVRISTDRVRYDAGQPVAVTVRLSEKDGNPVRGAMLAATASTQEGPAASVDLVADDKVPGRYFGTFPGLPAGAFRVTATGPDVDRLLVDTEDKNRAEARINVSPAGSIEQVNTRCNISLLKQIAEVTGGQVVPPTAIDELLRLSSLAPEVSEKVERMPLWNRWSFLAIAFACLCTEWVARKRLGLV
ncbi:MAG: hypothetical protein KDA93_07260 [Planctomycetaceae bacterium]|nr:hypothetical protein [Planctomycetaceae bacterium]